MPFHREWESENGGYVRTVNRDRTGPPAPPQTGTTQEAGGNIVGDANPDIPLPPPTTIKVTIPGPRERVIDTQGTMTPKWRRFFEELYRRTGYIEDNVNSVPFTRDYYTTITGSLAITGSIPQPALSSPVEKPATASVTITGTTPTVV